MKFLCTVFSLISLFSVQAAFDSLRSETKGELVFVIHEVEEEETLYSIARRYKSSVLSIIEYNQISDNRIDIGQVIRVLYNVSESGADESTEIPEGFHLVQPGETLYSISRAYDLRIRDLRRLNKLPSNDISPGEYLRVIEVDDVNEVEEPEIEESQESANQEVAGMEIPEGFETYIVQTTETLNSIARKKNTSVADLKEWNNLDSDYIRIGQKLLVRTLVDSVEVSDDNTESSTRLDEDGFEKVYEEGIAGVITDISTSKYLALHRSMPIGTELEVRNLMNNFVVHVKVVGKLPNTGINRNILLRLSKPAFDQLGILDPKSRVEVSHFKK